MEELVKSKNYLKKFIKEKIDGNLKVDNAYLNEFVKMKRFCLPEGNSLIFSYPFWKLTL